MAEAASSLESALKADPSARPPLDGLVVVIEDARLAAESLAEEAAVSPSAVEGTLDRDLAREALALAHRLRQHLTQSDLAATRSLAALRTTLGPRFAGPFRELETCIDRLDFDAAATQLAGIESALARAAEEP